MDVNQEVKQKQLCFYQVSTRIIHQLSLFTGLPSQLVVEPEGEQVVENGKAAAFKVLVQDMSGNSTTTDSRQSILCKVWVPPVRYGYLL